MSKMILHVCENVKKEVELSLQKAGIPDVQIQSFSSYCGYPPVQKEDLEQIQKIEEKQIHLAVGSICLKGLKEQKAGFSAIVTEDNCFYFFLNKELVDHYILDGAYLITPGWLINWKKQLDIWKFDQPTARTFFAESCKYLLFLDTGVYENMDKYLTDFSSYIQVNAKTLPVGLDFFRLKIIQTLREQKLEAELSESLELNGKAKRQLSEYAMAFDLVGNLAKSQSEQEAIDNILVMMNMLFAPGSLHYLSFRNNKPGKLYSQSASEYTDTIKNELADLKNQYKWTDSGKGFCLSIKFNGEILGALHIDELSYPQYKEKYLNLGLFLTQVCGLAISKARTFNLVQNQKDQLVQSYGKLMDKQEHIDTINRLLWHDVTNSFSVLYSGIRIFKKTEDISYLNDAAKQIEKGVDLIRKMRQLSYSMAESETLKIINVRQLTEKMIINYKIHIEVSGDCNVLADDALMSVIDNLVSNAIRHAQASEIIINLMKEDDKSIIEICDDGKGIPDEFKKKVFEKEFFMGKSGNTGLGLYIVKKTIERYEGEITILDNVPKGTIFRIELKNKTV
ncbi:ATP-binding protein [Candidatus Cloacimonadota bacterium]